MICNRLWYSLPLALLILNVTLKFPVQGQETQAETPKQNSTGDELTQVNPEEEGWKLFIRLTKKEFQLGEAVPVDVTFRNDSLTSVGLNSARPGIPVNFLVKDEQGVLLPASDDGGSYSTGTLPAGKEANTGVIVSNFNGLTKPGTYFVKARWETGVFSGEVRKIAIVESNTVKVTFLPRK